MNITVKNMICKYETLLGPTHKVKFNFKIKLSTYFKTYVTDVLFDIERLSAYIIVHDQCL